MDVLDVLDALDLNDSLDALDVMDALDVNGSLDTLDVFWYFYHTPFGRFCPTRRPFGLTSLPEIFNKKIDSIIKGVTGVVKSMDDFLVFGHTESEYKDNLHMLLNKLMEHGVTLNKEKCVFNQTEVECLGHKISKDGISPLERKLDAINEFPVPRNIKELRSFLGMAQKLAKFSPELANAAEWTVMDR